ncbi:MATE family efflux transporter [Sedimentibacter sp.]|uniref:MATE family efflux transporter n=1 Tax=Sedimentibacter sp. TaxID=1960295 RepID=UPI0028A06BE0|nr:MATE family efflux transporter [Sedimentibacter sp.]
MTDLTEGNISRQIIRLAFPLLIGNIIQQFYNTINMMIVGRYVGENAFAAVGVSGSVMNFFIAVIIGLCVGFSILFASSYGAKDYDKLRKTIFMTAVIGLGMAVILSLTGFIFVKEILHAIKTPEPLFNEGVIYLRIIFIGMVFCVFYNLNASILQAIGKTNIMLFVLLISMICNLLLNYTFVAILRLEVKGAALATISSQAISAAMCIFYIRRFIPKLKLSKADMVWDKKIFAISFKFGFTSSLQQSSLYFGKLLVQSAINALGTAAVMAYTADILIEQLLLAFGDSGAAAIAVFVAQNYGHNEIERVKNGLVKGLKLMVTTGVILSGLLFILKPVVLSLLISRTNIEVTNLALGYLGIMCIFYPLSFVANSYQGYFRGIGMIHFAFIATFSQIVIRVILIHNLTALMHLNAVALSTGIGWIAMISIQSASFYKIKRSEFKNTSNS